VVDGLLGRKIGMIQLFGEDGKGVVATVMEVGPCTVVRVREDESHNNKVVQLGFEDVREKKLTKPLAGHFKKAGVSPKRHLKEVTADKGDDYGVGQEIRVDVFSVGQKVDVTGISKGKGFAGMVRRWKVRGGPESHGSMFHRRPGSIGSAAFPSRVFRGKRMPGHAGHERVTVMNLKVIQVRPEQNVLLVKGCVPGPPRGIVFVRRSVRKKAEKQKAEKQ
jgi:large subunit ribosomal protein L3